MGRIFKAHIPAEKARQAFLEHISPPGAAEEVVLEACTGRVLADDIASERNVPHYRRSAMDGYAVKASDTRGASPASPVLLQLSGKVEEGSCAWVHTGAEVPEGADAVLMVEDSAAVGDLVEARAQVYPGRNVGAIGEDIKAGALVFKEGHLLRPCDAAVLASLGLNRVRVFRKPVVAVIPTGDELISRKSRKSLENAGKIPPPGKVLETNGLMASLYVEKWGGKARITKIVPDDPKKIREAVKANMDTDLILLLGGTSVGTRDHAPEVIEALGTLLIHGVGLIPGKPTAFGVIGNVPVVCLPGYPVAELVALYFFVRPGLRKLGSIVVPEENPLRMRLAAKISSKVGYLNFVRVVFEGGLVRPLMGAGSGVLSSVAKADGFVLVPENLEGYEAGEEVDIFLIE